MKNLNDPRMLLKQIGETWRVFLLIAVAEIIGGCVGLLTGHHVSAFLNLWIGGAFGAGVGLIGGMVWHYSNPVRRNSENREAMTYYCIAASVFCVVGWFLRR